MARKIKFVRGPDGTPRVLFNNGRVVFNDECCCEEEVVEGYECNSCSENKAPATFKLVVSGIANNNCGNCASLNGAYFLTQRWQYQPCVWGTWPPVGVTPCPPCCLAVYFYLRLNTTGSPAVYSLSAEMAISSTTSTCQGCGIDSSFTFKYESSSPIDCLHFAQQLTRTGSCICTADSIVGGCDLSGLQIYVEAV